MDLGLEDRVVAVTGGSKGIGLACAAAFAGEGARVAIVSRPLLRNLSTRTNSPPSAPSGLTATMQGVLVRLSCDAALDAETPSSSLTYNLRVGTAPGGVDVVSPMSNAEGFRFVPSPGNDEMLPFRATWSVGKDGGFRGRLPEGARAFGTFRGLPVRIAPGDVLLPAPAKAIGSVRRTDGSPAARAVLLFRPLLDADFQTPLPGLRVEADPRGEFAATGRVDAITTTLGKALGGAAGGCVSGRREIVEMCRQRSRPYLFSNSLPPVVVAASIRVIEILSRSTERRDKLEANTVYWRKLLTDAGFDIKKGSSSIVPVMLYNAKLAQGVARDLSAEGIYVVGFFFPVVAKGQARIRTQVSAAHSREHLDRAIAAFTKVGKRLGVV